MASKAENTTLQVESTRRSKASLSRVGRGAVAILVATSLGVGIAQAAQPRKTGRLNRIPAVYKNSLTSADRVDSYVQREATVLAGRILKLRDMKNSRFTSFHQKETGTVGLETVGLIVNNHRSLGPADSSPEFGLFANVYLQPNGKPGAEKVQSITLDDGSNAQLSFTYGIPDKKGWTIRGSYLKKDNKGVEVIEASAHRVAPNEQLLNMIKAMGGIAQANHFIDAAVGDEPTGYLKAVFPRIPGEADPVTQPGF